MRAAGGHHHLRIAGAPFLQHIADQGGKPVRSLFDQHGARAFEKAFRRHGIHQCRRIAPEVGGRQAREPHLGRALGTDQAQHRFLPLQRHAHRILPEDQQAGARGIGLRQIAHGLGAAQDHASQRPEVAISCVTIWSARMRIRR